MSYDPGYNSAKHHAPLTDQTQADLLQLAREAVQNAEYLTERRNYAGAIKEYNRAVALRKKAVKL